MCNLNGILVSLIFMRAQSKRNYSQLNFCTDAHHGYSWTRKQKLKPPPSTLSNTSAIHEQQQKRKNSCKKKKQKKISKANYLRREYNALKTAAAASASWVTCLIGDALRRRASPKQCKQKMCKNNETAAILPTIIWRRHEQTQKQKCI